MSRPSGAQRRSLVGVGLLGLIAALALSGCYRRTIETKGIGASHIDTEEPYAEDWPFETIGRELEQSNDRSGR